MTQFPHSEKSVSNQFALLGTRRFLPLFLTQFLGAFNDQVFQKAFVALVTYRLADKAGIPIPMLGVIASGLFILPFAFVTPTAGQIADRMDKAVMMRWVKGWEIVVMGLAVIGYHTQSIWFLYFVLFLMGAQSAVFAPIKYSIIPQYLHRDELMGGNGLVQGSTFLAIIFGTIVGNELVLREDGSLIDLYLVAFRLPVDGVTLISIVVVAIAVAGFLASLFAPPAPPSDRHGPVDWLFPRAIWRLLRMVIADPAAIRTILAISWFWFLGATFLSLLPAYARLELGVDEGVLTALLAAFSVGVAIGAVASEALSRGQVGVRVPPIGALGLALMAVELWFATPARPMGAEGALLDRAAFFDTGTGWRILIDFVLLAAFAGLYVTPLNAVLQDIAPDGLRASYIAGSNVVDATFIVLSAVIVTVLVALGVSTAGVLVLVTLTGLPMGIAVARHAPETQLGRMALAVWPRGSR
jgi:MFS family permease